MHRTCQDVRREEQSANGEWRRSRVQKREEERGASIDAPASHGSLASRGEDGICSQEIGIEDQREREME